MASLLNMPILSVKSFYMFQKEFSYLYLAYIIHQATKYSGRISEGLMTHAVYHLIINYNGIIYFSKFTWSQANSLLPKPKIKVCMCGSIDVDTREKKESTFNAP